MSGQTTVTLETLPSLGETIVLHIIEMHQPVSGYQIRRLFTEMTNKRLSFGTLVPMLHRFERAGLAVRAQQNSGETAYSWFLTPLGSRQLDDRLSLLEKMFRVSSNRREPPSSDASFTWEYGTEKPATEMQEFHF